MVKPYKCSALQQTFLPRLNILWWSLSKSIFTRMTTKWWFFQPPFLAGRITVRNEGPLSSLVVVILWLNSPCSSLWDFQEVSLKVRWGGQVFIFTPLPAPLGWRSICQVRPLWTLQMKSSVKGYQSRNLVSLLTPRSFYTSIRLSTFRLAPCWSQCFGVLCYRWTKISGYIHT